jgi:hypothetical protein
VSASNWGAFRLLQVFGFLASYVADAGMVEIGLPVGLWQRTAVAVIMAFAWEFPLAGDGLQGLFEFIAGQGFHVILAGIFAPGEGKLSDAATAGMARGSD